MRLAGGLSKTKSIYACQQCAAQFPKWAGQCSQCGAWNALVEESIITKLSHPRLKGFAGENSAVVTSLADVELTETTRFSSGLKEFDLVLGGGLVLGSVVLIGGDPGIGKSTLLLQSLTQLSQQLPVLYVTGEESLQQVRLRAERLNLQADKVSLLAETQAEKIILAAEKHRPQIMVIDSIQTVFTANLPSAPGSVGQVRESAAQLVQFAKRNQIAIFLVGHVTKEGALAGPRILEHMVDAVLYFEGDPGGRYRMLRAVKNRFGAVNELGLFAMTEKGLREVNNPSAIFLVRTPHPVSGSVVLVSWEGSRPLLVEVQALVDSSHIANPRRVCVGLEYQRLAMLLAVLHRHGGIATYDQDVFLNVVGGVRILETAADLALLLSVVSSLKDRPLPRDVVVFGEVGLAGEIRPVQSGQQRLHEAFKHGFKRAIIPAANAPKQMIGDMEIHPVSQLSEALALWQ